jgi:lysozyme
VKLSPQGLHLIASFEGFVPTCYDDSAGNCTIGYGHLVHYGPTTVADRVKWGKLTVAKALELLNADAATAQAAVTSAIKVRLGIIPSRQQARYDALVSLAFNIGAGGFASSSLVRQINAKGAPRDWTPIGPYWLEWDHAGGVVVQGLLNRRRTELAAYVAGKLPAF